MQQQTATSFGHKIRHFKDIFKMNSYDMRVTAIVAQLRLEYLLHSLLVFVVEIVHS